MNKEVIGLLITFISHRFSSCPDECIVIHEMVSKPEEKKIFIPLHVLKPNITSIELVKKDFPIVPFQLII